MGARGNSGVIFSQIVRGFVEVLGSPNDASTPRLRRAFRGASDAAYRAVKRPVEGTMLTVIREMAEEGETEGEPQALAPDFLAAVLARGEDARRAHARDARRPPRRGRRRCGRSRPGRDRARSRSRASPASRSRRRRLRARRWASTRSTWSCRSTATARCSSSRGSGSTRSRSKARSSRSATPSSSSATTPRSRCTSTPTTPGSALSAATTVGVVEGVEIANMHRQTAAARGAAARAAGSIALPDARDRARRRLPRRGQPPALREPRGDACHRGRSDDEPLDRGDRRGDRGDPGARRSSCFRTTRTSSSPPSRRSGSARSRSGSSRRVRAGRARGDAAVHRDELARAERAGDARGAGVGRHRRDHRRLA